MSLTTKTDSAKCLTIHEIFNILAKDLSEANKNVEANKHLSIEKRNAAAVLYKTAKNRWQSLWQIHGKIISNANWEANFFDLYDEKKYKTIEECLQQAKSFEKW